MNFAELEKIALHPSAEGPRGLDVLDVEPFTAWQQSRTALDDAKAALERQHERLQAESPAKRRQYGGHAQTRERVEDCQVKHDDATAALLAARRASLVKVSAVVQERYAAEVRALQIALDRVAEVAARMQGIEQVANAFTISGGASIAPARTPLSGFGAISDGVLAATEHWRTVADKLVRVA
jgi:hypothetical protein